MAEVTMDIAELDQLRNTIKEKEKEVQAKLDIIKEKDILLAEVKSDKRIMKITKVVNESTGKQPYTIDVRGIVNYLKHRPISKYGLEYNEIEEIAHNLKRYIVIQSTPDLFPKEVTEYVNFDDVRAEARAEFLTGYQTELDELRNTKASLERKILSIETNNTQRHYELLGKHNTEISELNKKITELETGKQELTEKEELIKQIADLTEQLKKEQEKSWWSKLVG